MKCKRFRIDEKITANFGKIECLAFKISLLDFNAQTWTQVLSYQGRGHEMAHTLSYNHSILFKIVSVESFSNVDFYPLDTFRVYCS